MASECDESGSALDLYELYSALNNFIEEPPQQETQSVSGRSYFGDEPKKDKWNLNASASKNSISDLYPVPDQAVAQARPNLDSFAKKDQANMNFAPASQNPLTEVGNHFEKPSLPITPPELDLGGINDDFLKLKLRSDDRLNLSERKSNKNVEVSSDKLLQKRNAICSESISSIDKAEAKVIHSNPKKKLLKKTTEQNHAITRTPKKIKTEQTTTNELFPLLKKPEHPKATTKSLKQEKLKEVNAEKGSKSFPTRKRNLVIKEPQWTQSFHSDADSSLLNSPEDTEPAPNPLASKIQRSILEAASAIFDKQILSTEISGKLDSDAQSYLKEALKKKFYYDSYFQTFSLRKVRRRTEEHFKLVTKLGFKFMFKNFKKLHNNFIRGNKLLDQLEFYKFYFGKHASDAGERLESFFLPSSKIQRQMHKLAAKADKTVSFAYLQKIFGSQSFRDEFVAFLTVNFVPEYLKLRQQKLAKLASNFAKGRKENGNKLPWTTEELFEAQKYFIGYIASSFN
jgi:hypothetical protein